jgi:hypothetical protein
MPHSQPSLNQVLPRVNNQQVYQTLISLPLLFRMFRRLVDRVKCSLDVNQHRVVLYTSLPLRFNFCYLMGYIFLSQEFLDQVFSRLN